MRIMAFDVSKANTGWAVFNPSYRNGALPDLRGISAMKCGSFKSEGDSLFETIEDFHPKFLKLVREYGPDHVVFEEGLSNIPVYETETEDLAGVRAKVSVNANSSLVLQRLLGDVQAVLMGLRKSYESVTESTWRKAFLGYGRKAGMNRKAYKKAARMVCDDMHINVTNDDQAEAAGVCYWAITKSQAVKEMVAAEVSAA